MVAAFIVGSALVVALSVPWFLAMLKRDLCDLESRR